MLTGTPSSRKPASPRDAETRIGWRMAGLGMESVSYVAGGVVIGWGLSELARRWDWGGGDWWVIGGAAFGLASGMSQLIRGALRLNRQLDRAAAGRPRAGAAGPNSGEDDR